MATVAFAGDWHGDTFWAKQVINVAHQWGIKRIYHVGDFGIWPGEFGASFIRKTHKWLDKYDMEIWVTPGNHEWWPRLEEIYSKYPGQVAPTSKNYPRIKWLPRGHRWEDDGISFVSLGGAPSIDRDYRSPGKSWWPEEVITEEDVERTVAGGYADIMITHDSPNPGVKKVQQIVTGPSTWPPLARIYSDRGRELMTKAFEGVQPKLLVHGHYHVFDIHRGGEKGNIISLANEHMVKGGNVALIDSEEFMSGEPFEIRVPWINPDWNL